jgi:ParB family transcriptional regulator, chromosome partitioning protein
VEIKRIRLDMVSLNPEARPVDKGVVKKLAESMGRLGQLNPVTVFHPCFYSTPGKCDNVGYGIIAGGHRYAAAKLLGWEELDAYVIADTDARHHRLIEISENLHRSELTTLERSRLVSEWAEMTKAQPAQLAPAKPQYEKGGINDAARQLGIERTDVQRAVKIASLSPEAQDAAVEAGLDNNQAALLDAAQYEEPEAQVEALKKRKKKDPPTPAQTTDKIIKLLKSIRADRLALTEVLVALQSMLKE